MTLSSVVLKMGLVGGVVLDVVDNALEFLDSLLGFLEIVIMVEII